MDDDTLTKISMKAGVCQRISSNLKAKQLPKYTKNYNVTGEKKELAEVIHNKNIERN